MNKKSYVLIFGLLTAFNLYAGFVIEVSGDVNIPSGTSFRVMRDGIVENLPTDLIPFLRTDNTTGENDLVIRARGVFHLPRGAYIDVGIDANLTIEAQAITNEGGLNAGGNLSLRAQRGVYNRGTIRTRLGNTEIRVPNGEFLNGGGWRPEITVGDDLTIEAQAITNEGLLRAEDGNMGLHAQTGIYNYGTLETPTGETEIDVPNGEFVNGRPQTAAVLPRQNATADAAAANQVEAAALEQVPGVYSS